VRRGAAQGAARVALREPLWRALPTRDAGRTAGAQLGANLVGVGELARLRLAAVARQWGGSARGGTCGARCMRWLLATQAATHRGPTDLSDAGSSSDDEAHPIAAELARARVTK